MERTSDALRASGCADEGDRQFDATRAIKGWYETKIAFRVFFSATMQEARSALGRTVRSGRDAWQRLATVFACCWKMPLTEVASSPTVMTAAVGFLSATPLMPTPAEARPENGEDGNARVSFAVANRFSRLGFFGRSSRARRCDASRERQNAPRATRSIPRNSKRGRGG